MNYFVEGVGVQDFIDAEVKKDEALVTYTTYDSIDRTVHVRLPDGSENKNAYSIDGHSFVTTSTDPLGNVSIQKANARELVETVIKKRIHEEKDDIVLTYEYNVLGEMLKAYPNDTRYPVSVEYDMLGRRVSIESSDSGLKEYGYNSTTGQLLYEKDSNLSKTGQRINYTYDAFGRVLKIDYPESADVMYEYFKSGVNGAGQVKKVIDETGSIEYVYGELGEVKTETRTILHLSSHVHAESREATMHYESDYLGRMNTITYPDGEVVTYGYDYGGQVNSVVGVYEGLETRYVEDIGYDEYSQRVYIKYGNGVETEYSYDKERRWLDSIVTTNSYGLEYQNILYNFDAVGNVNYYINDADGYYTEQNYFYDDLYQLTSADGKTKDMPYGHVSSISEYKQGYTFDDMGNMLVKTSMSQNNTGQILGDDLNYSLDYVYDENYAHRVTQIGNIYYEYDLNGNVIREKEGGITEEKENTQEAQFVIQEEADNVYSSEYGWALENTDNDDEAVVDGDYERHYAWNERNMLIQSSDSVHTVQYRYGVDGQRAIKSSANSETLYFNSMWSWIDNVNIGHTARESKNIFLGSTRLVTRLNGEGDSGNTGTAKESTYYYHADHLGSAQMVTNHEGVEYERIEYTPYGETWIEKASPTNVDLPYKFTGKELDEETGLYYYGARYLDPKTSRWLSTDPALGEYIPQAGSGNKDLPGLGGIFNQVNFQVYHYGGNNPIKYVDPDGRAIGSIILAAGIFLVATLPAALTTGFGNSAINTIEYYREDIVSSAEKHGVDPLAVASVIYQEKYHGFFASAKNDFAYLIDGGVHDSSPGSRSYGLAEMQLTLAADFLGIDKSADGWKEKAYNALSDPKISIDLIAQYVKKNEEILGEKLDGAEAGYAHNMGANGYIDYKNGNPNDLDNRVPARSERDLDRIKKALELE